MKKKKNILIVLCLRLLFLFVLSSCDQDCYTCDGDGRCNACGGDGRDNFNVQCTSCDPRGSGKCWTCGGSGKL